MNPFFRLVRLTKREYFADFFITPPLTAVAGFLAFHDGLTIAGLAEVVLGWGAWTLYEYGLHRWALHHWPVLIAIHGLHHKNQNDYIAIHPLVTLALYVLGWLLIGTTSSAFMIGFSLGYISYSVLHTVFHYVPHSPQFLAGSRNRHVRHHLFGDVNFGITVAFWDWLFGTAATKHAWIELP